MAKPYSAASVPAQYAGAIALYVHWRKRNGIEQLTLRNPWLQSR
jgi:hypothetical protein